MAPVDDLEAAKRSVHAIQWWHTIDLGRGLVTPGADPTAARLTIIQMPETLTNKTVLDVGAWDGFFSFEAERRGARRVLATDSFCWGRGGWGNKAGFELARRILGSRVDDKDIDPLDLSPDTVGEFDVVLFLGVLYHMKHPLLALERVASVTREQLILQTQVDLLGVTRPAIAFYEGSECNNDPTNWCGPNPAAVCAMLRTVGFTDIRIVHQSFPDAVPVSTVNGPPPGQHMTVHAFR